MSEEQLYVDMRVVPKGKYLFVQSENAYALIGRDSSYRHEDIFKELERKSMRVLFLKQLFSSNSAMFEAGVYAFDFNRVQISFIRETQNPLKSNQKSLERFITTLETLLNIRISVTQKPPSLNFHNVHEIL